MDRGLVNNPKDLERMQHELVSLERRITSLEDEELEVMERLEEAQQALDSLLGQLRAADERLVALGEARDQQVLEIEEELAKVKSERDPAAADIPAELLALYDRLRENKGGVGAAALRARQCGGCRLSLDNAELAVIRKAPSDEVIRCEECQRILVRTAESGL
jgi:predicted  nucleic acid-binding Zn-ribbon protein